MGMVVRSNIMAMNANRSLGMNNSQVTKNLEKLSSGFKINRAGDDASGLAISEKMKAQIKGLETASANSQDGISLVQTAEGALTEVHSMLNRMIELATKSANGTIQDDVDRDSIQSEVDALLEEVDRIGNSTNFNGIKLLDGSLGGASDGVTVTTNGSTFAGLGDNIKSVELKQDGTAAGSGAASITGVTVDADGKMVINIKKQGTGAALTSADIQTYLRANGQKNVSVTGTFGAALTSPAANTTKIEKTAATIGGNRQDGFAINFVKGETGLDSIQIVGVTATATQGVTNDEGKISIKIDNTKSYSARDINKMLADAGAKGVTVSFEGSKLGSDVADGLDIKAATTVNDGVGNMASGLVLQVGDTGDSFNMVSVSVDDMRTGGLGLTGLDVSTADAARASIDTIKAAINQVSTNRGNMGALQNRLEYTINNLDVSAENMTAANSRIRDTDMAKQMMEYTKQNVLTQAAQAMLAQANQQPQSILQLLQ